MNTESINERSRHIDQMSALEMVTVINTEDRTVAKAVERALPAIADVVDKVAEGLKKGGRLIYVGAGTSGRLAVQDAAECTVTYGVPEGTVSAIMAGGNAAVFKPSENVEDDGEAGFAVIRERQVGELDCVVGISASGNADYVCGALDAAKQGGALTVALLCNERGKIAQHADCVICVPTGAEVICGSTRMKAGTAQKMVLNMISTAAMVKLGRVTGNFMTWMTPSNEKLKKRAAFIVSQVCEITETDAERLLGENGNRIQDAIRQYREG